ncbi:MAG: ACT domain-containing protein [bacterium]
MTADSKGEQHLTTILENLEPTVLADTFVFCTVDFELEKRLSELKPLATMQEKEGLSLVLSQSIADQHGFTYEGVFQCVSLRVHSSLESVGLTAKLSTVLAESQIPANIIAGYYHDHILVPVALVNQALIAIKGLSEGCGKS